MAAGSRREPDRALRPDPLQQRVRRSASVVAAKECCVHPLLFHPLPEVSALALLPADDAWPGADALGRAGREDAWFPQTDFGLRPRAAVLLPNTPAVDSRPGRDFQSGPLRPGGLVV